MQVDTNAPHEYWNVEAGQATVRVTRRYAQPEAIEFGRFCALPRSRQLLLDGRPREIGGRAFDLLMVLLKSNGGIVSKEEIFNEVWPSMVVEECNLRFQVASLRRALGDHGDMIKTIVRRGYMLVRDDTSGRPRPGEVGPLSPALSGAAETRPPVPLIVLIEDDESVRCAIDGLLRSVGLQVRSFASADAFLERADQSRPDCLILDVCLPGRSGLDFQEDLARGGVRYPTIFISGHADVQMSVRGMKAGAIEFLTKPVRHQDLLTAVQLAIASSRASAGHLMRL